MSIKLKNIFISIFILTQDCLIQAQAAHPLIKIGNWENEEQLQYFYSLHARPLIIINNTVYIPDDRCIELRHFGGSYTMKDLDGTTIIKSEGAELAEKESEGTGDQKNIAAGDADKSETGGKDLKSRGAESEEKDRGGAIIERHKEGEVLARNESGTDVAKQTSGTDSEKTTSGTYDIRNASAGMDQKSYGGYTLFIKCYQEGSKFSLTDYYGNDPIKIYDINGLRSVVKIDIVYE